MENNLKFEFIKRIITDTVYNEEIRKNFFNDGIIPNEEKIIEIINTPIEHRRLEGLDWPERAHTMIGVKRLNNLHECLDYIRTNNIPGDFIETGVWRGGACIFMKYYNDVYNMGRKIFVADSFNGLPMPDTEKYPQDENDDHHTYDYLKVSLDEVKNNFNLYRLLDDNVIFLKGWFSETLKNNENIGDISLLRFDGDMYGSTIDVLENLYHKLNRLGVLIVDDYCLPNCVKAVSDFRQKYNINNNLTFVDQCGVFWYKE
jgi:O-methyltransferase